MQSQKREEGTITELLTYVEQITRINDNNHNFIHN